MTLAFSNPGSALCRLRSRLHFVAVAAAIATGCDRATLPGRVSFTGEAQGTYYAVTCYTNDSVNLQHSVDSLLKSFDLTASLWVDSSMISRVNRNEEVTVNADFTQLFRISREVSEATGGAFDITVGPLVRAWGFGPGGKPAIGAGTVDSLLPLVGYRNVHIKEGRVIKVNPGIKLDFNAVAQGYSVDLVGRFLESKGIMNYLVDIGGEVLARGYKPGGDSWRVGIEKPSEEASSGREIAMEITLTDRAVATSGNYRKYYEVDGVRYSHTIDPQTGHPVRHSLLGVSVVAGSCALADAYATAFMVMGEEKARAFLDRTPNAGLEACFITSGTGSEYRISMTEGLKGSMKVSK